MALGLVLLFVPAGPTDCRLVESFQEIAVCAYLVCLECADSDQARLGIVWFTTQRGGEPTTYLARWSGYFPEGNFGKLLRRRSSSRP